MATPIIMPKFGMTQTEATVVRWLVREGQPVQAGAPLLEVETDKVNMEVEAPASGIVAGISAREGQVVPVTETIGYIVQPEEVQTGALATAEKQRVTPLAARVAAAAGVDIRDVQTEAEGGRVTKSDVEAYLAKPRATPAARRKAREKGVDLAQVQGSGPEGRIQAADVEGVAVRQAPPSAVATVGRTLLLQGMRRTIARRMQESYQTAPHITLTVEADMGAAEALRQELNTLAQARQAPRVSVTAVLVKVSAWALRQHPFVNATLDGETIRLLDEINIGVAVALDDGLIVPVVHGADTLGIGDIARRLEDVSERARQGRLRRDDVVGGTFTISNLGMFGVKHFTAIINPPEAAILAVGRIVKRAIVAENSDQVVVRPMMEMTLSADHRVLDGATAARFLADVVAALERPFVLLW